MQSCYKERIFYYWTHCLYGHAGLICKEALEKKKNDINLIIYQSLIQSILGDTEQSLNLLNTIQYRSDLNFLILVSSYFIHKSSNDRNFTKINELKEQIQKNNRNLSLFVTEFSSEIAFLFGDYQLAEEIISKSNKTIQTNSILGWVKLMKGQFQESKVIFNEILNNPNDSFHLLTLYGKCKLHFQMKEYSEAIQLYARILSKFDFPEITFEKALIFMVKGNWNFLNDLIAQIKESLPTTIEIEIYNFLNSFYFSENVKKAVESLKNIIQICAKYENKNWFLMAHLSHAFGSIGCRNDEILFQSMKLAQMAVNARHDSSYCLSVLGFHQTMNRRIIIGQYSLFESIKYDKTNYFAEESLMRMNLECGNINLLKDQLDLYEYLNEKNLFILLFITKVSRLLHNENYNAFYELIDGINNNIASILNGSNLSKNYSSEILDSAFANVELPFMKYIELSINLNFETIFDSFDEILFYYEFPKTYLNSEISLMINEILKNMSILIPNNTQIQFYKGCFLYFQKKYSESLENFHSILLSINPFKITHTMMMIAAIYDKKGDDELASQYLDEALKFDKMISNETLYKYLDLKIKPTQDKIEKNYEFIVDSFDNQSFLNLLFFVDFFIDKKDYLKALNILKLMVKRSNEKIEKALIIIRQAEIYAGRDGNLNQALSLLHKLQNHPRNRESSILAEAEIYLNICNNDQKFIQILRTYTDNIPSQKNFEILGDGYSRLKKFAEASEMYISAINTNDSDLNSEIIQKCLTSLIKCHKYNDAVSMFIKFVTNIKSNKKFIVMPLLQQIIKIDKIDEVKKCIASISSLFVKNPNENWSLNDAEFLAVKAFFSRKSGDLQEAVECYEKSISLYEEIFSSRKPNIYLNIKKKEASDICIDVGNFFESLQRREKAFELYKKAYSIYPTNQKALLRLVNHYEQRQEVNKCVELCEEFVEKDPYNENVVLMLTSFRRQDLTKSIIVLRNFLIKKPNYHRVIIRMIEVCSRAGEKFLVIAKKFLSTDKQPGMIFARSIFDLHKGEIEKSLKGLKSVMNDKKWGIPSKHCMIEIYLNPKRKYIWEVQEPLTTTENIQKAQELIDQIYKQSDEDDEQISIEKELILAELEKSTNTNASISSATTRYQTILNHLQNPTKASEINSSSLSSSSGIAALVGLSACLLRLDQQKEAVNLIDQLIKPSILQIQNAALIDTNMSLFSSSTPTHETAPFFEEAYLMRAHVLLNNAQTRSKQAALHYAYLALDLNQSCRKGWEICADAYSKSGMFADAANAFKNCWILSKNDMKIGNVEYKKVEGFGYSFAETALKADKPEDALEMCSELRNINPCFESLKDKIIIPAFKMLKMDS